MFVHSRGLCRNCYDKWLKVNSPGYAERQRENNRKWIAANAETYIKSRVERQRKMGSRAHRKYRITREQYDAYMALDCGICGAPSKHLDHNHATGVIRGALCHRCNLGLGYLEGWHAEHAAAIRNWIDTDGKHTH